MTVNRIVKSLHLKPGLSPFPESFMFGVGNADHQCEAYDPRREDIRDQWERLLGLTMRGRATDFENRYLEDIALARRMGCTAFRFSIAWSRVEPEPGKFDDQAFNHYRRLAEAIHSSGMEPIVTLHHFTWPLHIESRGGMTDDRFPHWFNTYAEEAARRLSTDVRFWITFNEPNQLVFGYIKPPWESQCFVPPGWPGGVTMDEQVGKVGKLIHNLFVAHTRARQTIKRHRADAMVGANPLIWGLPNWIQRWVLDRRMKNVRNARDLTQQARQYSEVTHHEKTGDVDIVIALLSRTVQRDQQVMFSDAYFVTYQRFLVKTSSPATVLHDLAGKTVAVVKGSTANQNLPDILPTAKPGVVRDYSEAIQALDAAKADALLADDTILSGLMAQYPGQYRIIGASSTSEVYAPAVAKGNAQLLMIVDSAVRRFKESGEWAARYAEHFGVPIPRPPERTVRALSFSTGTGQRNEGAIDITPVVADKGTTLRRIQDRDYLITAVREDVPGFGYRDPESGELVGFEIDLARAIAKSILGDPDKVRFHPVKTQERISLIKPWQLFCGTLIDCVTTTLTIFASNWWHLGMAGELQEFLCPQECVGQQDFVGLDYYWGTNNILRIPDLIAAGGNGHFEQAPVTPGFLYTALHEHARLFPDKPLLIVENGSVPIASGVDRETYLRSHIRQVQKAASQGMNVIGYICWSITSNREWGHPFSAGTDFGLYHIALDTDHKLRRHRTGAAEVYEKIIADRGVF